MKPISLPMAELKNALAGLNKVMPRRMTLPILAAVKIERTSEGWVALTATDLDHYVTVRLEQPTDGEPSTVIIPYDELVRVGKACGKNDTPTVHAEKQESDTVGTISYPFSGQSVEHRCAAFDPSDFPEIPRFKSEPVSLPPALRTSIQEAFDCASTDETRLVLNGAFLDVSRPEGHYVVATDGRQLFASNSFTLPLKDSVLIPSHRFLLWKEFNNDGDWQFKARPPENKEETSWLQLTSRRWRFISRQIEGTYPNWRQVIPDESTFETTIELDPASLPSVIQTIERMPCHNEQYMTLGLAVTGWTLALLGKPPGAEQWTRVGVEKMEVRDKEVTIFVDRRYLARALKFGLNKIEITDAMSPLRLSNGGRQMIIMPVRPEAAPKVQSVTPTEEADGSNASPSPAPEAEQPAADEAAQPNTDNMPNTSSETVAANGTNGHTAAETKSPLELALEQIETVKGSCREAVRSLTGLADLLKQAQREHKTNEKEISSVRQTIRQIQAVRI